MSGGLLDGPESKLLYVILHEGVDTTRFGDVGERGDDWTMINDYAHHFEMFEGFDELNLLTAMQDSLSVLYPRPKDQPVARRE